MTFEYPVTSGKKFYQLQKQLTVTSSQNEGTPLVAMDRLKRHCRIATDITDEDENLKLLCIAAEKLIESLAEISLRVKVVNLELANWPGYWDYLLLRLEFPPINSVVYLKYYNESDVQTTMSSGDYEVWLNTVPPSIIIKADKVPLLSKERSKVVDIQLNVGYASVLPANAELLLMELTSFWFQHREAFGRFPSSNDGPQGRVFQSLLDSIRWRLYP